MMLTGAPPRPRPTVFGLRVKLIELNRRLDAVLLQHRRKILGMARVRMFGTEFAADVIKDNGDGTYLMRSRQHTSRTSEGTQFTAQAGEVTMLPSEQTIEAPPSVSEASPKTLDDAMTAERATLESAASIISKHRQDLNDAGTHSQSGVSVQPGPTLRPMGRPAQATQR